MTRLPMHFATCALLIVLVSTFIATPQAIASDKSETTLQFDSRGATLEGTLVMPADAAPIAAVIFVHGSGRRTRSLPVAHAFADKQIAAFVYDKRGVGQSGGVFEGKQPVSETNLDLLAADARAALKALAQHEGLQDVPLGMTGLSQAGWIVPLAAKASPARFVVLWSGPVCKISEEDIFSKYTRNSDAERIPSYAAALAARTTPYEWPSFLGEDTDSAVDLAELNIPGLWIFGGKDGSVPVDLSIQKLQSLQQSGHDFDYVLFSGVGHNNMRETFATAADWIGRVVVR